jgi:hypothetical protein
MTVQQIKDFYNAGKFEETLATSYSQGVFDGLISIEGARRNEGKCGDELCGFFEIAENGGQIRHPSYRTEELVEKWELEGYPMDVPFTDLAISYMTKRYGC